MLKSSSFLIMVLMMHVSVLMQTAQASHAVGGDITYVCLGNNQYEITLNFYRDCAGISAPTSVNLNITSQSCGLTLSTGFMQKVSYKEISPICDFEWSNSRCNGGTLPGIEQHIYRRIVTLPEECNDWIISYSECCRNAAITNLVTPQGYDFYIEAMINNENGLCNHSPVFTSLPVPYICINQEYNYNHGALDPEGDYLVYSTIQPLDNQNTPIPYVPGYTVFDPLAVDGLFNFSTITGQMNFYPNMLQNAVVTVKVEEYRDGVLIGYTMRDLQIIVINCSNNNPEATGIDSTLSYSINVCAGSPFCFNIYSTDPDLDNVSLTWNNAIPDAIFTTEGSPFETGTFCWTPELADTGFHVFVVTATDDACPIKASNFYIYELYVENPDLEVEAILTQESCLNTNDAEIILTVNGGESSYTYIWSHDENLTDSFATGLPSGVYYVTIFDGINCPFVKEIDLSEPSELEIAILAKTYSGGYEISCHGSYDGEVYVSMLNGGESPFYFNWSNTALNADSLSGLSAGSYAVTVTDANGCEAVDTIELTEPPFVYTNIQTPLFNGGYSVSCFNANDGSIHASVSGGVGPYNLNWNNGAFTGDTIENLFAGVHTVEITDQNNCVLHDTITLNQPDSLDIQYVKSHFAGGVNISCFGANDGYIITSVLGGTAFYDYSWNNGEFITADIQSLPPGLYELVVTDTNGCMSSVQVNLTEPDSLNFNAAVSDYNGYQISCYGANDGSVDLQITGGSGNYSIDWNNGLYSEASLSGLASGNHAFVIEDENTCILTGIIDLDEPDLIISELTASIYNGGYAISCFNGNDGSINAEVSGGLQPYTSSWNQGEYTEDSLYGLTVGWYILELTDLNNCQHFDSIYLSQPDAIDILADVSLFAGGYNISCHGENDGNISVEVHGGVAPYQYNWNTGDTFSTGLFDLYAGVYILEITDENQCKQETVIELSEPAPLQYQLMQSDYNGYGVSCYESQDGYILVNLSGGTGISSISWNSGSFSDNHLTNLPAGEYVFFVTDENNCAINGSTDLIEPPQLTLNLSSSDVFCYGGNEGLAIAVADGGVPDYDFIWSNNNTEVLNQGLVFGTYSLTVSDLNGCQITANAFIDQPEPSLITATVSNTQLFFGQYTNLHAEVISGLKPEYYYVWSPEENLSCSDCQSPVAEVSESTVFTVQITDNQGCTASADVEVFVDAFDKRVFVPNAFSPNGDDVNDVFEVYGVGIAHVEKRIFDRWGELLYQEAGITVGWDGTFNGEKMIPAVYVYQVTVTFTDGAEVTKRGSVTLVK